MESQPAAARNPEAPAERKITAGIDRAFETFGPNLRYFFEAVNAEIQEGEHKGLQMALPLTKSK